jgi:hypothetical protein
MLRCLDVETLDTRIYVEDQRHGMLTDRGVKCRVRRSRLMAVYHASPEGRHVGVEQTGPNLVTLRLLSDTVYKVRSRGGRSASTCTHRLTRP